MWSGKPDPLRPAHEVNPHIAPEVSAVLQEAMALDRSARPPTAAEMRRTLQAAIAPPAKPAHVAPNVNDSDETVIKPATPLPDASPKPRPSGFVSPSPPDMPPVAAPQDSKIRIEVPPAKPAAPPATKRRGRSFVVAGIVLSLLLVSLSIFFLVRNRSLPTLTKTLTGYGGAKVVFAPDGKTLASSGPRNTIQLWDVARGTPTQTLTGHSEWVNSVAFAPDGTTLASSSNDSTIKLWDVGRGTLKQTLNGHSGYVVSVAFSPDGTTLASGSYDVGGYDDTIKLWSVD